MQATQELVPTAWYVWTSMVSGALLRAPLIKIDKNLSPVFYPHQIILLYWCAIVLAGAPIRSRIRDLVPNGTKVPKWSQKVPILLPSPKFLMMLKRGGTQKSLTVGPCCALFGHIICKPCDCFSACHPALIKIHIAYPLSGWDKGGQEAEEMKVKES